MAHRSNGLPKFDWSVSSRVQILILVLSSAEEWPQRQRKEAGAMPVTSELFYESSAIHPIESSRLCSARLHEQNFGCATVQPQGQHQLAAPGP